MWEVVEVVFRRRVATYSHVRESASSLSTRAILHDASHSHFWFFGASNGLDLEGVKRKARCDVGGRGGSSP